MQRAVERGTGLLKQLKFFKFGNPLEVLQLHKSDANPLLTQDLQENQLLVKYLASPINPADINTIQGTYGVKPPLPATPGNEGVACVLKHGPNVKNISVGDNVIMVAGPSGSWSTHAIVREENLVKVDKGLNVDAAAQLKVNPCTAYRMLKDFVDLKAGDTIIQNGANSAVGVCAIQLAKLWNMRSINIIRDRPDLTDVIKELKDLGADYVLTEAEVRQADLMKKVFQDIEKPKLMLNCVGGKNTTDCLRHLGHSGYCVTYGGMSKQPFDIPVSNYIFKDHKYVGFWMSRWYDNHLNDGRVKLESMINELSQYFRNGQLKPKKSKMIKLEDYEEAIKSQLNNYANLKYIFTPE